MVDRERAWFRLLVDCLAEGQPSGRLLVRYLLTPEVLTEDERVLLEDRIATDAQVADQIEVLRQLLFSAGVPADIAGTDADRASGGPSASRAGS